MQIGYYGYIVYLFYSTVDVLVFTTDHHCQSLLASAECAYDKLSIDAEFFSIFAE